MKIRIYRMVKMKVFMSIVALAPFLYSCTAEDSVSVSPVARWKDGNPDNTQVIVNNIANTTNQQVSSDGEGGVIIVWQDDRDGVWNIYAQRLDSVGNKLWTEDSVTVTHASVPQINPQIMADGVGGVFITWQGIAPGGSEYDIYGQRLDSIGNKLWDNENVIVNAAAGDQKIPKIVGDSSGIILSWLEHVDASFVRVNAIKLGFNGVRQWANEVTLTPDFWYNIPFPPEFHYYVVNDTNGGLFIHWNGYILHPNGLQHVNSNGELLLANPINPLNVQYSYCYSLALDQSNGIFSIGTFSLNNAENQIASQRINSLYDYVWNSNINVTRQSSNLASPTSYFFSTAATASSDNAILVIWQLSTNSLYIQKINEYGDLLWQPNGVLLTDSVAVTNPRIISDASGGAIVSWDQSGADSMGIDIMAQRLNANGKKLWGDDNLVISNAKENQQRPVLVGNGNGGAIIVWQDYRNGLINSDIYAQGVSTNGKL